MQREPRVVVVSEGGRVASATVDGNDVDPTDALREMFDRALAYKSGAAARPEPTPVQRPEPRRRYRR